MSIPNFIQIRSAVRELNYADRQTWPALKTFTSCTSFKERITIFKKSVLTSKKTQHFTITKIIRLMCLEIIVVCTENHMKPINTLCGQNAELLIVKADGTYSYHLVY
jgi:hypothetical protein